MLRKLLKDPEIGKAGGGASVPDEARTFVVCESLSGRVGIYFERRAEYERADVNTTAVLQGAERNGQILEEGIYEEAGIEASSLAAGKAYSTNGINTIPFWFIITRCSGSSDMMAIRLAAAAMRTRGRLMLCCTSGRTTLSGEGAATRTEQPVLAAAVPNLPGVRQLCVRILPLILQDGIKLHMFTKTAAENSFYYSR